MEEYISKKLQHINVPDVFETLCEIGTNDMEPNIIRNMLSKYLDKRRQLQSLLLGGSKKFDTRKIKSLLIDEEGDNEDEIIKYTYSGNKYEIVKSADKQSTFFKLFKSRKSYSLRSLDLGERNEGYECMVLIVGSKSNRVSIHNISKCDGHVSGGQKKNLSGTLLLHLTLDFIKKYLKSKYNIKYVHLIDNSLYYCKSVSDNIEVDNLYMLTRGTTWYGKYGFVPYDSNKNDIHKNKMKTYQTNIEIMNKIRISDIPYKYFLLMLTIAKYKYNHDGEYDETDKVKVTKYYNAIKKYMDSKQNMLLKDFLYEFTMDHDDSCGIFYYFYKELMRKIGLESLHGASYFLKI